MTLIISLPKTSWREIKPRRPNKLKSTINEAIGYAKLALPFIRYTAAALCAQAGAALGNLIAPEMQFQGI